jgi:protein tyrosine phosphatase (PTP) superfamily phosphohydrolase (DUF442 family)
MMRFILCVAAILIPAIAFAQELPTKLINFYAHSPTLFTAGQPKQSQFADLRKGGVQVVVNMAPDYLPDSIKNEGKLVEQNGMAYYYIPVDWDRPSESDVKRFFEIMEKHKGQMVLAHCWANSRSSAFTYLYRTIKEGQPKDEEYKILETIWSHNKGYELPKQRQWISFLKKVEANFK